MKITNLSKTLGLALRKYKPLRKDINIFKKELADCLQHIKIAEEKKEHEEHVKNYLIPFLSNSQYQDHLVNTKDRIDLAIYADKTANSPVSVLIETKNPSNINEFLSEKSLNKKALQELVLYYLRERIDHDNKTIQHLIATNGYEWYFFTGEEFYKHFGKNAKLKKEYTEFVTGQKDSKKNELFYKDIAAKYIAKAEKDIDYVYVNIKDYEQYLPLDNKDDAKLISLYKLLSPTHLLNKPFGNDSNQLNKQFYGELLHLIGLEEVKDKGKKVIQRLPKGKRHNGSILESVIFSIEDRDRLYKTPNIKSYGATTEERLFNIGLELSLTWVNRILFLKLLESQLLSFHKNDKNYRFLHEDFIGGFDDLEQLFFSALAKKTTERDERYKAKYQFIPYLNSSLFEPTVLEDNVLEISNIKDNDLALYPKTILKNAKGKRETGAHNTLSYLFQFLEAYDFSSNDKEEITEAEQSKALINASVLGLIFEKINGYKDGSFYTPAYITMYMSRETLRRAVVQKMNTHYKWSCESLEDIKDNLREKIRAARSDRKLKASLRLEANKIINSLRICDPAVGSGHFLVSCLNELIAIKSELGILCDATGKPLNIFVGIENDELIIEDNATDSFFSYHPGQAESVKIQKALFQEKQTLIENCLFAVDINPNSVKICRLRLWIELLKNAYYNKKNVLQTLPNIDINIKCGNSLISRFDLGDDLRSAFKSNKNPYSLRDYKKAVLDYKHTNDKAKKRKVLEIINTVKTAFTDTLDKKFIKKIASARGKYNLKKQQSNTLFGKKMTKKDRDALKKLKTAFDKAKTEKEEILNNILYQDAFEWRFEFPEVLDSKGKFIGFDVVIGNPPYIRQEAIKWMKPYLKSRFETYTGTADMYVFFVEKAFSIMNNEAQFSYIMPNKWMQTGYGKPLRKYLLSTHLHNIIDFGDLQVFEGATTYPCIVEIAKSKPQESFYSTLIQTLEFDKDFGNYIHKNKTIMNVDELDEETWIISSKEDQDILRKLKNDCISLGKYVNDEAHYGIKTGLTEAFVIDEKRRTQLLSKNENSKNVIKPLLQGRDIQPYTTPDVSKHLLFIPWHFPLDNDPTISGVSKEAEKKFKEEHSSIYKHLLKYKSKLEKRNKVETGIRYEWYAMQRWASAYWQEFEKPKIMYQVFQVKPCFIYDDTGLYCNNSMWIIPKDDKALVAILNSKMGWWLISKYCTAIQSGYQLIWKYFSKIAIPKFTETQATPIITLVNQIIASKKSDPSTDTSKLEAEIDTLVYALYGLTKEEIAIVENS